MKEYIDSDSCGTYCNPDLPVAKFKVKLEGYGGWKIKYMRTWLPFLSRDKPVDMRRWVAMTYVSVMIQGWLQNTL